MWQRGPGLHPPTLVSRGGCAPSELSALGQFREGGRAEGCVLPALPATRATSPPLKEIWTAHRRAPCSLSDAFLHILFGNRSFEIPAGLFSWRKLKTRSVGCAMLLPLVLGPRPQRRGTISLRHHPFHSPSPQLAPLLLSCLH